MHGFTCEDWWGSWHLCKEGAGHYCDSRRLACSFWALLLRAFWMSQLPLVEPAHLEKEPQGRWRASGEVSCGYMVTWRVVSYFVSIVELSARKRTHSFTMGPPFCNPRRLMTFLPSNNGFRVHTFSSPAAVCFYQCVSKRWDLGPAVFTEGVDSHLIWVCWIQLKGSNWLSPWHWLHQVG